MYSTNRITTRKDARRIQNHLDSLRSRERISVTRNSSLLADICRLKRQVQSMNVSVNRLERARGNYDRYVQTCMVSLVQKSFRETGTDNLLSSGTKLEPNQTDHLTPTKTIGVQTSLEQTSTHISDWSISPDSLMHSTMLAPDVSDKLPPRDTPKRHNYMSHHPKPPVDMSSLVPPVINFSDLRTPIVPLQDTFSTPLHGSVPRVIVPPESSIPIELPTISTPLFAQQNTFQSLSNVSMIPQTYLALPHSYVLSQQPVGYPNQPFQPSEIISATSLHPVSSPATFQISVSSPSTSQLPVPSPATSLHPVPSPATFQIPVPSAISQLAIPSSATPQLPVPSPATSQLAVPSPATSLHPVPSPVTFQIPVPSSATSQLPVPPPTTSLHPVPSPATSQLPVPSPATSEFSSFVQFPETSKSPVLEATQPLELCETELTTFHTLQGPISGDTSRHQMAQTIRHSDTIPQRIKSPPPPPKHSLLSPSKPATQILELQTQFSHSRQSSSLPTIPEPDEPLFEPPSDKQPPVTILNNSVGMHRVPSAHEFALHHLDNLDRRSSIDIGDRSGIVLKSTNSDTHKSENDLDTDSSGPERISHLKSTPNQFDLTALLVLESGSDEEFRRKPSQVMAEFANNQQTRDHFIILNNLAVTLNKLCLNTTPGGARIYGAISQIDTFKPQISESNVVTSKIESQAATSEMAQLATWDMQALGNVFLSEITKLTLQNGAILNSEILSKEEINLDSFNNNLPFVNKRIWNCLLGHFSALLQAKMSVEDICATFVPFLVEPLSSNDHLKTANKILLRILSEIFDLKETTPNNVEPSLSFSSDLNSESFKEDAYQHLLKSMALEAKDGGVKSGIQDDILSAPSSLVSDESVKQDFNAGINSKSCEESPTQLLEQAVREESQSDSSDSDVVEDIYVPSFAPSKLMSDREKKTKFEKFWGSDLDSDGSESEPMRSVKRKTSKGVDEFDFF
ncbi:IgGFc-binding protein-like [Oopsacas minuta]|uniref:IgGFc-binding protein-like n=1 Tax=Oopsacas minuta TaxID=111878 RepID=A0AAV7KFU6_9METZ|nr:IgGFc-binding protein-like [Oopsacas minuta]